MMVPVRWLKDYVDIPWSPEELADRLTMSGAKVEGLHVFAKDLLGVLVGEIEAVNAHPDSDRLWVCRVNVGARVVQSISGAPNTQRGVLVPVAMPGAVLPGLEGAVRAGEMRGVMSEAVLCSEAELGISEDHSGLMILPDGLHPGEDLVEALGLDDTILEFEIYPNRPDCLSVLGLAREVAALTGGAVRSPESDVPELTGSVEDDASVEVKAPDLCPRYLARVIHNLRIGPSPAWLQERIRAAGVRPINNVVDVTNFVMLELGQPLHTFDYQGLAGRRIIVRRANSGETMTTLDGDTHTFSEEDLLICDAERPVAIAGIMGGEETEVSALTTTVLLESATFSPVSIRKTARRLGLRTEASHRFEKDLDPHLSAWGVDRAARLLAKLAGGEVARGRIDVCEELPQPREIALRPKRVNSMLGTSLSPAEMKRILKGLEFEVDLGKDASTMAVRVPSFRRDVEGEADLVEEIARISGYDQIEATLPTGACVQGKLSRPLPVVEKIKQRLIALSLSESITYSFISPRAFDRLGLPGDHPWRRAIPLENPLSEEQSVMRTTLAPSLLECVSANLRHQNSDVRLFEIAKVYVPAALPLTALPVEKWTLGLVMTGRPSGRIWGEPPRDVDFYDLKGVVESVCRTLGAPVDMSVGSHPSLHPGRSADLAVAGESVGLLGEVHPRVAEAYELRGRVYIAELDLQPLIKDGVPTQRFQALPRFPAVDRDLALLVPRDAYAADVVQLIEREGGEYLRSVSLFDVYEGEQIPAGFRSVGYTMTYQSGDRTLTDEEIARVQTHIEKCLHEELGVKVRA